MKIRIYAAAGLLLATAVSVWANAEKAEYYQRAAKTDMALFRELNRAGNDLLTKVEVRGDMRLGTRFDDIDTNRDEIVLTGRSPFQGAKVANISPAIADELHLDSQTEGVVVIDLADGGTAASVGFQKGDIILAVNNQKIAKTSDLDKASKVTSRLWRIVVVRGGQQINVTLGG